MRSDIAQGLWGDLSAQNQLAAVLAATPARMEIPPAQWRMLTELSFRKTEADIASALRARFKNSKEQVAVRIEAHDDLAQFVHEIVDVGRTHGFVLRGDLYSLVEAAAIFGRDNVLLDVVLTNANLSAQEKVSVIIGFCKQVRSFRRIRSP